ncbi:FMN-binding protein [Mycetocola sp. 2940]|uniref:FMN-binding protein n=1 Tax=Mycetocola sp. 2940 TaxID=3156452 RepID=UPI003393A893
MQIRTRQNVAAALAGIAMVGLAGCSGSGSTATERSEAPSDSTESQDSSASAEYQDGEYTAEGSYVSPGGPESVTVTLTLEDSTITALEVTGSGGTPNAKKFQGEFIEGIDEIAVGKNIDELDVSRVAGSSLTSGGFNNALEQIRADAS